MVGINQPTFEETGEFKSSPVNKTKLPTLSKDAAKKRIKAFTSLLHQSKLGQQRVIVKKDESVVKKKKVEKRSVIEQIKQEETRLKEVLVLHNCNVKYLGTGLATLQNLMDDPVALSNFEKKGRELKNRIAKNELWQNNESHHKERGTSSSSRSKKRKSEKEIPVEKKKRRILPKSWKQLKSFNISLYKQTHDDSDSNISPVKVDSRRGTDSHSHFSPLDDKTWIGLSMHKSLDSLRINRFTGHSKKEYPGAMIRTTVTRPHITFSKNSGKIARHFMTRAETKFRNKHSKDIWNIMKKTWSNTDPITEYQYTRDKNWYTDDWISFEHDKQSLNIDNLVVSGESALTELSKKYEDSDMSCDEDEFMENSQVTDIKLIDKCKDHDNYPNLYSDSEVFTKESEICQDRKSQSVSPKENFTSHSSPIFNTEIEQHPNADSDVLPEESEKFINEEDKSLFFSPKTNLIPDNIPTLNVKFDDYPQDIASSEHISPYSTEDTINGKKVSEFTLKEIKALICTATNKKNEKRLLKDAKKVLQKAKKERKKLKKEKKRLRKERKKQKKLEKQELSKSKKLFEYESMTAATTDITENVIEQKVEEPYDSETLYNPEEIPSPSECHYYPENKHSFQNERYSPTSSPFYFSNESETSPIDSFSCDTASHIEHNNLTTIVPLENSPPQNVVRIPTQSVLLEMSPPQNVVSIPTRIVISPVKIITSPMITPTKIISSGDTGDIPMEIESSPEHNSSLEISTVNIDLNLIPTPMSKSAHIQSKIPVSTIPMPVPPQNVSIPLPVPAPPQNSSIPLPVPAPQNLSIPLLVPVSKQNLSIPLPVPPQNLFIPLPVPPQNLSIPLPVPPVNMQSIHNISIKLQNEVIKLPHKESKSREKNVDANTRPVAFRLSLNTPQPKLAKLSSELFQEDIDERIYEIGKFGPPKFHVNDPFKDFARIDQNELSLYGRVDDSIKPNIIETILSAQGDSPSKCDIDNQRPIKTVQDTSEVAAPTNITDFINKSVNSQERPHSRGSRHSVSPYKDIKMRSSRSPSKRNRVRSRSKSPYRRSGSSSSRSRSRRSPPRSRSRRSPQRHRSRSRSPRLSGGRYRDERRSSKGSHDRRSRSPPSKRRHYVRTNDSDKDKRPSPSHTISSLDKVSPPNSEPIPSIEGKRIESITTIGENRASFNIDLSEVNLPSDNPSYGDNSSCADQQQESFCNTLSSPKRPSLNERLRNEHGVYLEDSPATFDTVNSSGSQPSEGQMGYWDNNQTEPATAGSSRVIRIGNVLQILPQELPPGEPIKMPQDQQQTATEFENGSKKLTEKQSVVPLSPSFSPPPEGRISPLPPPSPVKTLQSEEIPPVTIHVTPVVSGPIPGLSSEALLSAAAAASAASNVPFAHLISVLQEQNLLPKCVPLTEPEKIPVKITSTQEPTEPLLTHKSQLDVAALKNACKERKMRKKQEKEKRREERKRQREQELAKQTALQQAEDDDDEALIKEAISEVPELEGPIPDYYLMDDEIAPIHKSINIPPPPEKGILVLPTYKEGVVDKQKSVWFADFILPGDGTSASGEENKSPTLSTPAKTVKRKPKKDRPKKKKAKTKQIRLFDPTSDGICSPPPPPDEPPHVDAIKLYPGWSHCTYTTPESVILYTQLLTPARDSMQEGAVIIPPGMLIHSAGLIPAGS